MAFHSTCMTSKEEGVDSSSWNASRVHSPSSGFFFKIDRGRLTVNRCANSTKPKKTKRLCAQPRASGFVTSQCAPKEDR